MTIEEYSKFIRVPLLPAGTFTPQNLQGQTVSYSEEDLDAIVQASNELQVYIQESIDLGKYPGNDHIVLNKPIPPMVNIIHQKYLQQTLQDVMKSVKPVFEKIWHKGRHWVGATLDNIPQEWAEFIKDKFPFRSVEIISNVTHPETKKFYANAIRSIGFLDVLTTPAVPGQGFQDFAMEFTAYHDNSQEGITTIYTSSEELLTTPPTVGEIIMEEQKEIRTSPDPANVPPVEMQALESRITEMEGMLKKEQEEKQQLRLLLEAEQKTRQQKEKETDIAMFCSQLQTEYEASPKYVELVQKGLALEFKETENGTPYIELKSIFEEILQAKKEDLLQVPIEHGHQSRSFQDPGQNKQTIEERQLARIAEFADFAKKAAKTSPDEKDAYEKEIFSLAYNEAIAKYGDNL